MTLEHVYRHLSLLFGLLLAACQSAPSRDAPAVSDQLGFFDSQLFDKRLSHALKVNQTGVTTNFIKNINVNEIPPRLDQWLTYINENEGQVALVPEGNVEKGLLSEVISLIFGSYNYTKEKLTYAPAKKYNATLYYDASSGEISRLVFVRRN